MSNWLQKQSPFILHHGSDLPYIILEDGVKICHKNSFCKNKENDLHNISFIVNKNKIFRQSTHIFKIIDFPVLIPFENIIQLDSVIIDGKIIKICADKNLDNKEISLAKLSYVSENIDSFIDNMYSFDHNFIIKDDHDELDPTIRLMEDEAKIISNSGWERTALIIADELCPLKTRKYCWTSSLPSLNIHCFGLTDWTEKDSIQKSFSDIGVSEMSIIWSD